MILIADSGTTKTEWCIITDKDLVRTVITSGINPFYQDSANIVTILNREYDGDKVFSAIYFYGAGCINEEKQNIVKSALGQVFFTEIIIVGSDLLAAAHSLCGDRSGIACILGTGSNSCLYDGYTISLNVSPLGFILGDEGSGAVMGKKLVGDILKKQLPQALIEDFYKDYQTNGPEILDNVYKRPFPSRYLANYAKFLSKNIGYNEIEELVINSFDDFIKRNLLQYPDIESTVVHFTGSIAFVFETQLKKAMKARNLMLGTIERAPMQGLIKYHQSKL